MGKRNKNDLKLAREMFFLANGVANTLGKTVDNVKKRVDLSIDLAQRVYFETEGVMPRMVAYRDAVDFARKVEEVSLLSDSGDRYWQGIFLEEQEKKRMRVEGERRGKMIERVPARNVVKRTLYGSIDESIPL
jgi:hypothetical protein